MRKKILRVLRIHRTLSILQSPHTRLARRSRHGRQRTVQLADAEAVVGAVAGSA